MKDRIRKILQEYGLTSTNLADKIGVQRSSISHLLSGRNKPGFDFIHKLLKNYPDINPHWLIMGEGSMYISEKRPTLPFSEISEPSSSRESNIPSEGQALNQTEHSQQGKIKSKKHIEKIVVFYSDHSFDEYHPNEE